MKAKYDDHLQATLFDKKQSIAEPSRAALLPMIQIMSYTNCSLEKPETKNQLSPVKKSKENSSYMARRWRRSRVGRSCAAGRPRRRHLAQPHASSADGAARDRCGFFLVGHRGNVPSALWLAPGLLALQRLGFDDPPVSPPPPVLTFDTANLEARATPSPGVAVETI